MEHVVLRLLALLIVAIFIGIAARRMRLPYTVGLVLGGIALAASPLELEITLSRDLIFYLLLPPLLFEGAINISWTELRRDLVLVLVLTVLGVVISAAIVSAGMVGFANWPIGAAVVFGVLIAATDPVAVIALFKDMRVQGRLRLLIEAESLLNDGVAAVFFALALAWADATSGPLSWTGAATSMLVISGGGIAIGFTVAAGAMLVSGRTSDHLVEAAVTTAAAYGSFIAAEMLHCSGVLATVICGLVFGNRALRGILPRCIVSERGREFVLDFWEFAAFLANSFIFLLFGITLAASGKTGFAFAPMAVAVPLVLAGRALSIYPIAFGFRSSALNIPIREQHVLWWGGLRGALALALALSLPPHFDFREQLVATTFTVVAFSVLAQGATMPLLLRVVKQRRKQASVI